MYRYTCEYCAVGKSRKVGDSYTSAARRPRVEIRENTERTLQLRVYAFFFACYLRAVNGSREFSCECESSV